MVQLLCYSGCVEALGCEKAGRVCNTEECRAVGAGEHRAAAVEGLEVRERVRFHGRYLPRWGT